jgi:hypothetical protein
VEGIVRKEKGIKKNEMAGNTVVRSEYWRGF